MYDWQKTKLDVVQYDEGVGWGWGGGGDSSLG